MIVCEKCHTEFQADHTQGYPGHVDPPGSLLRYCVIFLSIGLVSFIAGLFARSIILAILGFACVGGSVVALMDVPQARRECERMGGGTCPQCGHKNEVKWNS